MIGFTQPGKLIVENIKMYQRQWDLAANGYLVTSQHPGYYINLVSFNLLRSYKLFPTVGMFATFSLDQIFIGANSDDTNSYMNIKDRGLARFEKFFQPLTGDSCDIMVGHQTIAQSRNATVGLAITLTGTVTYDVSLTNPYCYLSLAYYLVPTI